MEFIAHGQEVRQVNHYTSLCKYFRVLSPGKIELIGILTLSSSPPLRPSHLNIPWYKVVCDWFPLSNSLLTTSVSKLEDSYSLSVDNLLFMVEIAKEIKEGGEIERLLLWDFPVVGSKLRNLSQCSHKLWHTSQIFGLWLELFSWTSPPSAPKSGRGVQSGKLSPHKKLRSLCLRNSVGQVLTDKDLLILLGISVHHI